MSVNSQATVEIDESSVSPQSFLFFLLAVIVGLFTAGLLLPVFLPNMAFSLAGDSPKAYWYLSRATAFVSLSLLWLSMMLGLGITNKLARQWPGASAAFAMHEYVSLGGLVFAILHALVLLGDRYIHFTLAQILTPFAAVSYRSFWVGLGQTGFFIWAIVALSFYIRPALSQKAWRLIHYASFLMYLLGLFHGIFSGTDTGLSWVRDSYWFSAGSLLFMLIARIVGNRMDKRFAVRKAVAASKTIPR